MSRATAKLLVFCLLVSACDVSTRGDKAAAEANGISGIPEVTEFAKIFPDADHFITYYTGTKGDPHWNSKAGVHGRYVIDLKFKIDFDAGRTKPKRISPPVCYLREVSKIESRPDGGFNTSYTGNQLEFGIDEWRRLRDSGGDLSVLGINVLTDQPLEHFDKASQINALPAASRNHHELSISTPEFGARSRQRVTGLKRSAGKTSLKQTSPPRNQASVNTSKLRPNLKVNILSFLLTPSGAVHIPSLLAVVGWLLASVIMFANLSIAGSDRRRASLEKDESNQRAEADRKKIATLETATKPRRMTSTQREALMTSLSSLSAKPKIFIAASTLDSESMAYAEDIEAVLIASGFEVRLPKGLVGDALLAVSPPGLHFAVKDRTTKNPVGARVQRCFVDAGIEMPAIDSGDKDFPDDKIEIVVGQR